MNGTTVAVLGTRAEPTDRIVVDGKLLQRPRPHVWVALHKPAGVVTTARDPEGRPTVTELVPHGYGRLFPVGRLDVQSTGLVLLTNDGETAARVLHPRHHVPRRYRVKVRGAPDERALARLRRGVTLDDGRTGPARVRVEKRLPTKTWLEIVVFEGRSRLVRRACDVIGHAVEKLQRVALGPIELGGLARGACRELTAAEVTMLRRAPGYAPRESSSAARHRRHFPGGSSKSAPPARR